MKKLDLFKSFKSKKFKYGGYATLMTAVVIAIVLIVNLVIEQIPLTMDMTQNKMFSLSDQTKKIIDSVEEDVELVALYETGSESPTVDEILQKYSNVSKNISYRTIDPIRYPQLVSEYQENGESLDTGDIIVKSGERNKIISRYDMYNYSQANQYGQQQVESLAVEQQITSAINYVTTEDLPVIYTIAGHDESSIGYDIRKQIGLENFEIEELNLVTQDAVPEDASILVINSPKRDISKDELDKIESYIENAGKAMIFLDYINVDMPNMNTLLKQYGLELQKCMVVEMDKNHYSTYPHVLVPEIQGHSVTSPLKTSDEVCIIPSSMGLGELDKKRRTVKVEPLLTTTDQSFGKTGENTKYEKEEGDIDGPFNIAVAVTDNRYEDNESIESKLVVVANARFINDQQFSAWSGNSDFVLNSINYLADREESISIRPKDLRVRPLTITASQSLIWAVVVIVIIPLAILLTGLFIWLRRRHL